MGYLTQNLAKKKKWSKTKLELVNIGLNLVFLLSLYLTLFIVVQEQQKCQVRINGYLVNFSIDVPPNITDMIVFNKPNWTYCHNEMVCSNHTVCVNMSYNREKYMMG